MEKSVRPSEADAQAQASWKAKLEAAYNKASAVAAAEVMNFGEKRLGLNEQLTLATRDEWIMAVCAPKLGPAASSHRRRFRSSISDADDIRNLVVRVYLEMVDRENNRIAAGVPGDVFVEGATAFELMDKLGEQLGKRIWNKTSDQGLQDQPFGTKQKSTPKEKAKYFRELVRQEVEKIGRDLTNEEQEDLLRKNPRMFEPAMETAFGEGGAVDKPIGRKNKQYMYSEGSSVDDMEVREIFDEMNKEIIALSNGNPNILRRFKAVLLWIVENDPDDAMRQGYTQPDICKKFQITAWQFRDAHEKLREFLANHPCRQILFGGE